MPTYTDALALHKQGWQVVPAKLKDKAPLTVWKSQQSERQSPERVREMFGERERNIFLITGSTSGLVVLDCDDSTAQAWWADKLGGVLEETTAASTGKGVHYYFRVPVGEVHKGRASHGANESGSWDFRADGGGVIAPPSVHPSGALYAWLDGRGPEVLRDAPSELWSALDEATGTSSSGAGPKESGVRTTYAYLMAHLPEEGGRNDWLIAMCGHLARQHRRFRDAYDAAVAVHAALILKPLPEAEVVKTANSAWDMEHAKLINRSVEPEADSGYVVAGNGHLLVQVRTRDGQGSVQTDLAEFLDAKLTVNAKIIGEEWARDGYDVRIERASGEVTESANLPTTVLGDGKRLTAWLTQQGIGGGLSPDAWPKGLSWQERLRRYLNAQDAPEQQYVTTLGWHDEAGGFVCLDGIITAEGKLPLGAYRPHHALQTRVPYRYGIAEVDELGRDCFEQARDALRTVMDFHHEQVCAVFGSWWAATFVKPQLMARFSQFPVMAMEAPSESGKSSGFFPLMMALSGAASGEGTHTPAALRDYLASHRNGIVWMDDLDSLDSYSELIRGVTVGATKSKKGADQTSQKSIKLEGALVLSGEALGLGSQKALADRALSLKVPTPVGRVNDAGEDQWEDVKAFAREVDPFDHAGTLLWMVAQEIGGQGLESAMARAKRGQGRFAEKMATVRAGCWLLRRLYGWEESEWIEREVEAWIAVQTQEYDPRDNALTLEILPAALAAWNTPRKPYSPDPTRNQPGTPVFVGGKRGRGLAEMGRVWFSPHHLAVWWERAKYGRVQIRVGSEEAIKEQAHRCGVRTSRGGDQRQFTYADSDRTHVYWGLDAEMSRKVLERALGTATTEEDEEE